MSASELRVHLHTGAKQPKRVDDEKSSIENREKVFASFAVY
jgi:hypothetical protein